MDELQVGDLIATSAEYGRGVNLDRIVKVTPTTYVCAHRRFRKADLRVIGATGYGPGWGRVPTPADHMKARVQKARESLRTFTVNDANVAHVETMLAATKEPQP